jgi:hypothetical protein
VTVARKVIAIPGLGWEVPEPSEEPTPLAYVSPLAEMAALAASLKQGSSDAREALDRDRRRLQQAATDELHRLVGRTITEVALAGQLRDKIARAVAEGSALIASRPPDHVIAQVEDPSAFVERCVAACAAVKLFLAAELDRSLAAAGLPPIEDAADWVQQAAEEVHAALVTEASSDLDRKAHLAMSIGASLGVVGRRPDRPRVSQG